MSGFLVKLQPDQDVIEALEAVIARAGVGRSRIIPAVGSLAEGVLLRDGRIVVVEGPPIEVAALSGAVEGQLVPGRNAVGVTFELLLQPCDADDRSDRRPAPRIARDGRPGRCSDRCQQDASLSAPLGGSIAAW